jgi:phospholipase/carboxylesterase
VPTVTDAQLATFGEWTFRFRPAQGTPERLLILLHGWTGDENSMGVLAQKLASKYSILAPRAPFPVPQGGYSWRKMTPGTWGRMSLEELRPAAESLLKLVDEWPLLADVAARPFDLMGFSQGACMSYAFAMLYPGRVRSLAALSGFLPDGMEGLLAARTLAGKLVFVAHGRQDDMVAVERARRAVALLQEAGVAVTYCESDGGHRVSKECLRGMEEFFGGV